jgi:hypothetical protein
LVGRSVVIAARFLAALAFVLWAGVAAAQGPAAPGGFPGPGPASPVGISVGGLSKFPGYDGSPQFATGLIPGAVEYFDAMGGLTGNGATLLATNGSTGPVSGNFAAQETGGFYFGNGSGGLFEMDDPGGPSVAWLRATPAITGGRSKLDTTGGGWQLDFPNSVTSQITQNGQVVAEFGTAGIAATTGAWVKFTSNATTAALQATGLAATPLFLQAGGTAAVTVANSSGNQATFNNSSANTAVQFLQVRSASTAQPVLLQPNGQNIAIGGTGGTMAALATTATSGYAGIPAMAGPPTGVPTQVVAGVAYLTYNTTSHTWNIYDPVAASWYHVTLTAGGG